VDYDIVVATKDRPAALQLSIPLFLAQTRPPVRLIIVDASRDHSIIRKIVQDLCADKKIEVIVVKAPANSSAQRNCGLRHVKAPIVMFPDDDSLWYPDVAEVIIRLYKNDKEGIIGGVCAAPVTMSPLASGVEGDKGRGYRMSRSDRLRQRCDRLRHRIDYMLWPDPFWILGRSYWSVHLMPPWAGTENVAPVEYMGGYRMSFRAEVIKRAGGFDEVLGYQLGWAAGEDADASFKVARTHLILGARRARVFHHRFPGPRGDGFLVGFFVIFNRAYIVAKYASPDSPARRAVKRFAAGKLLYYMAEAGTRWGRDRIRGVRFALENIDRIFGCDASDLVATYKAVAELASSQCCQVGEPS